MTGLIDRMAARFPDFADAIRGAKELRHNLGALFQEYEDVEHRLSRLDQPGGSASLADADRLRRHRAYLEEEMLTMMQHHGRP